ncbi:hypothetical protein HF908_23540 (plasmid) [Ralstonia pseudosolanacearum]|uniref:hypothetical protein n=1 Tax=Ralstonia pseudosolanacearum TaxID=1310165 RepID=UPI0018669345|nr:hypothetical protein [Ralstonia pseudosolanacearum]QOK94357.1 hypothetical protein HF908_23540 [Ralstonia pseudosolanacearum]
MLSLGYTPQSSFTVSVGREYRVFAMALWQGVMLLLLADDHHLPNWFPMCLFSVSDSRLPDEWSFCSTESNEGELQALWGYEQLIADTTHYDGLLEREPEALRYFYEEETRRLNLD